MRDVPSPYPNPYDRPAPMVPYREIVEGETVSEAEHEAWRDGTSDVKQTVVDDGKQTLPGDKVLEPSVTAEGRIRFTVRNPESGETMIQIDADSAAVNDLIRRIEKCRLMAEVYRDE